MAKKKTQRQPIYRRLGTVDADKFIDLIPLDSHSKLPKSRMFFDKRVRLTSSRYKVYATKGCVCAECGLHGKFFALEQSLSQKTDKFHFNLYGYSRYGEEIMLTVDHIIPKSKGGTDDLDNKQCLCFRCNNKKGDKLPSEVVVQK